jgi:predicted metal-dependent HD superfamily phosphohydrolase
MFICYTRFSALSTLLSAVDRYYLQQKREKALLATVESYKQLLEILEKEVKKLKY